MRFARLVVPSIMMEQLKFHWQEPSVTTSAIEQCRKQLHIAAIAVAALSICYFAMVLGNALRWSVLLWAAMQMPTFIAGIVLAVRMWIYT